MGLGEEKKDLIRLLGENKENKILTSILEELHQNSDKWNFGTLLALVLKQTKRINHYPTERYGTFLVTFQEGRGYLKIKIDYDIIDGKRVITYLGDKM